MSELLRIEGLSVRYGAGPVVHRVSLAMGDGTVAALLGANGAGKSSTLRAIAGLEPAQGRVVFDGQDISHLDAAKRFRAGIVYVPEGRAIVTDLSVAENLTLGSYFVDSRTRAQRQQMVLDFFPEIANRLKSPAGLLSGGEQQMLAIGRALMNHPRLLILDEPVEGLAPVIVEEIVAQLKTIKAAGVAILLVEQNLEVCVQLADRHYIVEQGVIVHEAGNEAFMADHEVKDRYLGVGLA